MHGGNPNALLQNLPFSECRPWFKTKRRRCGGWLLLDSPRSCSKVGVVMMLVMGLGGESEEREKGDEREDQR